jgi:hypothetical protein
MEDQDQADDPNDPPNIRPSIPPNGGCDVGASPTAGHSRRFALYASAQGLCRTPMQTLGTFDQVAPPEQTA